MNKPVSVARILAAAAALALAASTVCADRTYLALGDSISTGYQPGGTHLGDGKFASIVAAQLGLTLDNQAVDGNTAAGIYAQVKDGDLDVAIASAVLLTITVGGNDIIAALYAEVAQTYNATHASAPITASEVPSILSNSSDSRYFAVMFSAYSVLNSGKFTESASFTETLAAFTVNFTNVVTYINSVNPSAPVVVETQYNPYQWLGSDNISALISNTVGSGVQKLNAVIENPENGAGTLYRVADVCAAFSESSVNLCCATGTSNLDFHPNPTGHVVIAETMLDTLCFLPSMTVNGAALSAVGGGSGATAWMYSNGTNLILSGSGPYVINGSNDAHAVSILAANDCTVAASNTRIDVSAFAGLSAIHAGGHTVTLAGGTFVLKGAPSDISGAVNIAGGSVRLLNGTFTAAPSNGSERVWCVTVPGFAPSVRSVVAGLPATYNTDNLYADASGNVYLWLPAGDYAAAAGNGTDAALKGFAVASSGAIAGPTNAVLSITSYHAATGAMTHSPAALDASALETVYSTNFTDAASWTTQKPEGAKAMFLKLRIK